MGTDIHTIFQAKDKDNNWYDIPHNYNEDRHYSLFAWLADVRQGNNFIKPISPPRGLPTDFQINEDYEHSTSIDNLPTFYKEWYTPEHPYDGLRNLGYHNFSWLLGSEILANKPPLVAKQGIIDIESWRAWDKVSPPSCYCAGVSGPNVHIVMPDVADVYESATHVHICWIANLEQEFKSFTDEIRRLMDLHGEIRMVFGFDS
jgi:hypothetical protein